MNMKLLNPCRPLPAPSLTFNPNRVMTRWKTQLKRIRPSNGPNYVRITHRSLKILVSSHLRMMKLAPLLFDNLAIERQVAKRFEAIKRHVRSQTKETELVQASPQSDLQGDTAELLAGAWQKLRSRVMEEAWQNLSPEIMEALKLEWQVLNLASHVTERASTNLTSYLRFADLSISEFLTLTLSVCEIAKAHRWNVPPRLSQLDAGLAESSMEEMVQNGTISPQNGTAPECQSLPTTTATQTKRDRNAARHSNNIIRLTTFLSAMHVDQEQLNRSTPQSECAAVG
jgi:hypothetical protein